jgi:hypothetical protein
MRTFTLLSTVLMIAALSLSCGKDNAAENDAAGEGPDSVYPPVPTNDDSGSVNSAKNLASLQSRFSQVAVSPTPWAGYWWPYSTNGISASAAKYDAAAGAGSSAASWESGSHGLGLGDVADWWGHCNGWAAAAILTREPRENKQVGGVNFGVADRKALLTEAFMEVTGDFLGTRVDDPSDRSSPAFMDLSPAQFYLMLTNVLGAQRRALVMDRFTGYQVWNHPVVAAEHAAVTSEDYIGPDPQFPNVHRVNMATRVWWVDDNVAPDTITPEFAFTSPAGVFQSRVLRYELWLDAAPEFDAQGNLTRSGDIILARQAGVTAGGVWKNSGLSLENSHPDYMWIPTGVARSSGYKNPRISDNWVTSNMPQ